MSDLVDVDRLVLLGEPGSGKSTVLTQIAADVGCEVVTARDFVHGTHPVGQTVFIDALEEYSIGEAAHDRVAALARAVGQAAYSRWRIACRAISLPPASANALARLAGEHQVWEIEPLDRPEQIAILTSLREVDPLGFVNRVEAMAGGPLLGNPATLKLLRSLRSDDGEPVRTRGELFSAATRAMAHEVNPVLPDQPHRAVGRVIEAAEQACLVLLLSARSDIWSLGSTPPGDHVVTRDDLLPGGIDTEALRFALDTPMFRGEGGSFVPVHRIVAEYLGGRALARATAPEDGRRVALSLERAIAFLNGDDDRPAPALTGLFAWFVTELANTIHAERALKLIVENPEAVLFHGDAAMLPTRHRLALLEAAGREDPWFLGATRGSTAIGGLAGDDLAEAMEAVIISADETNGRKAMVLEALRLGPLVRSLRQTLRTFALEADNPGQLRRRAIEAFLAGADQPSLARRELLDQLNQEPPATSTVLRLLILPDLIGNGATTEEVRRALLDYDAGGDGVMGYARPLTDALRRQPPDDLFDERLPVFDRTGGARRFELKSALAPVMAELISSIPSLTADRLLAWLTNAGLQPYESPDEAIRAATRVWMEESAPRAHELFWGLAARGKPLDAWRAPYDFYKLTGLPVPQDVRSFVLDLVEAAPPGSAEDALIDLAVRVVDPHEPVPELYWRLWALLEARPEATAQFRAFTQSQLDTHSYRPELAQLKRAQEVAAAKARDQAWLAERDPDIRSGAAVGALCWAAEIYLGLLVDDEGKTGMDAVAEWCGPAQAESIVIGWEAIVGKFPISVRKLGSSIGGDKTYRLTHVAAAWLDLQLERGAEFDLPLPVTFAALSQSFVFSEPDRRRRFEAAAVRPLLRDAQGEAALVSFWRAALGKATQDLPHLQTLEKFGPVPAGALRRILHDRPEMKDSILSDALAGAARVLPLEKISTLVQRALSKSMAVESRRVWRFVAFLLDPVANEAAFDDDFADPAAHALFNRHGGQRLLSAYDNASEHRLARSAIVVRRLGPIYPPTAGASGFGNDLSQFVAGAIETLAHSPTEDAGDHLQALVADARLAAWSDVLRHQATQQSQLRRETAFRPPSPASVAKALAAGPPATAADLRAVITESIRDLARDVRDSDTASWRGYWNRPGGKTSSPKIENDCRDLLMDRLRDRMLRFGIKVRWSSSEARSLNDRRADMLILGEEGAAVPLEAKRHFNPEIWTAAENQLLPYTRSAGSNGHGIYLIFWFGIDSGAVPNRRGARQRIETPGDLQRALEEEFSVDQRAKIDVVVLDLSEPASKDTAPRPKRARRPQAKVRR